MRPGTVLAVLGALLLGLGAYQLVRTKRKSLLPNGKHRPATIVHTSLLVLASCIFLGCEPAVTAERKPPPKVSPLLADFTDLNLESIAWYAEAKGEFQFRNSLSSPVQLKLGPPSCTCLRGSLEPEQILAPGEVGRLSVFLNTFRRTAGPVVAHVLVLAGPDQVPLKFSVKGFLDGIVFPKGDYVIRPIHRREQQIPPLSFKVVTHCDTKFEIERILCRDFQELREITSLEANGKRYNTDAVNAKLPSRVTAEMETSTISLPVYDRGEMIFTRDVMVPIQLDAATKNFSGQIVVDYVLDGKPLQAVTNLLVLAIEESQSDG